MTKIALRKSEVQVAQQLETAGVLPLMARLLAARGVTAPNQLSANLSNLLPPNTLTNNQAMAKLLADAILANKKLSLIHI